MIEKNIKMRKTIFWIFSKERRDEKNEGHFTHWEKRTRFFQNKRIYTDLWWIFLENKRIFAKGVRDFWKWNAPRKKTLLEGKVCAKRPRGRSRKSWMKNIMEWAKLNFDQYIRGAEDRDYWRGVTTNLLTWSKDRGAIQKVDRLGSERWASVIWGSRDPKNLLGSSSLDCWKTLFSW